jgi:glycosyltransferase involved in cell wall biosynthesis
MRVIALLTTYNERRFIESCLGHLHRQGIEVYLIDNGSTDATVELAKPWLDRNLIGIESFPRGEGHVYDWRGLLRRKEELARELDADWFIHLDADEIRLPPAGEGTLAGALGAAEREGFNAVNFIEFTFIPTLEEPDHDHRGFQRTMRTYYPFAPAFPHQLKAWKRTEAAELAWSGGHRVRFPGLRMYPTSFPLKHYLFLSVPHAIEKYVERKFAPDEVELGWHGWRATIAAEDIRLPSESELRLTRSDADLDPAEPRTRHCLEEALAAGPAASTSAPGLGPVPSDAGGKPAGPDRRR